MNLSVTMKVSAKVRAGGVLLTFSLRDGDLFDMMAYRKPGSGWAWTEDDRLWMGERFSPEQIRRIDGIVSELFEKMT